MIRTLFLGCCLLWIFSSCRNGTIASESWRFPGQQWITGDNKTMVIHASDTTQAYAMDVKIEHSISYPFQNIYIRLLTTFPSGKEVKSITSLELANADGSWSGKCGGKTCRITLPLQKGFTFPEIGDYHLTIEPYMRIDTIEGIKRMSIQCRKRAG